MELRVYPVYTVLGGRVLFAEGEVLGAPGDGHPSDRNAHRLMQLTGRETERLLIFAAAELARRRMREGILLSQPDCVALASDVAMEAARAGRSYAEVQGSASGDRRARARLLPGVAELLEHPLQVEATFGDGSRLVALRGLVRP